MRWSWILPVGAAVLVGAASTLVAASPALAVPGRIVVTANSAFDSTDFKIANPQCPAGKVLLGGGSDIVGGGHDVFLDGQNLGAPGVPVNSVWAGASERPGGYSGNWYVTAWAICGSPLPGYTIVQAESSEPVGTTMATATATCPAGKKLIGAGGISSGKKGVILDTVNINASLTSVYVESFLVESPPSSVAAFARAYAVCANPVPGLERVSATSASDSNDKTLSVACPVGKTLHGVGGGITGAFGQAYLDMLAPNGSNAFINAREDATGTPGNWKVDVYGICAD